MLTLHVLSREYKFYWYVNEPLRFMLPKRQKTKLCLNIPDDENLLYEIILSISNKIFMNAVNILNVNNY